MVNKLTKFLCSLLFMLAFSLQGAYANDDFEQKYNFMAVDNGNGSIHFRVLAWSYGTLVNHYAGETSDAKTYGNNGHARTYLEYSTNGNDWNAFFEYIGDNWHNKNTNHGWVQVWVEQDQGSVAVTNKKDQLSPFYIKTGRGEEVFLNETDKEGTKYLEFDWYPNSKIIKAPDLQVRIRVFDCTSYNGCNWRDYDMGRFNLSQNMPQLFTSDALLVPDGEGATAGKLAIPYSTQVTPVSYQIGDNGKSETCNESSGFVYVDASDICNNAFFLKMDALRNDDQGNPAENWHMVSKPIKVPAYHSIQNFKLERYTDPKVYGGAYLGYKKLSWDVLNANQDDVMPDDKFLIYRAYSEDFSDEEYLGQLDYVKINSDPNRPDSNKVHENVTSHYEYIDSVPAAYCNPHNPEAPIYYRVQRATSLMWGTKGHAWVKRGLIKAPVYLAQFQEGKIKGEKLSQDSLDHTVTFTFPLVTKCKTISIHFEYKKKYDDIFSGSMEMDDDYERPMWWDKSAQIILHRHMKSSTEGVIDIPVNPNNISYDAESEKWIATVTDVPNLPCTEYTYDVEIVPSEKSIYPIVTKAVTDSITFPDYSDSDIDVDGIDKPDFESASINSHDCSLPIYSTSVNTSGLNLYFDNAEQVTELKASQGEYNDHILLSWSTNGGESDYYNILRSYKKDGTVVTDTVQKMYTEHYYEDRDVVGGVEYTYQVESVLECGNGKTKALSKEVVGSANRDAFIAGRVQYTNGVALENIKVVATYEGATEEFFDTTDSLGYFNIRIPNRPKEALEFTVSVSTSEDYGFVSKGDGHSYTVTIGDNTEINLEGYDFYSSNYVRFTGRVLYENTTVPVPGVAFEVNGNRQKNVAGKDIVTDSQGEFALTVPKNKGITIKAVKDGHVFLRDGLFYQGDGKRESNTLVFTGNMDNVRMYDMTKVRLIGRVAGGRDEAQKTLGMGESQNLIGDDLLLVFALEGNDVAHLVHNPKDPTVVKIDTTFAHYTQGQSTRMQTEKKRILINPDVTTGEFVVELLPVKYEITQASAKGHATLFEQNMASAVIDLTDKLETKYVDAANKLVPYNDTYVLTYHSPLRLTYEQTIYGQKVDYFGEPEMALSDFCNKETKVNLYDENTHKYLFEYPVFNGVSLYSKAKNKYTFFVSAHEDYYYNNDSAAYKPVQVPLHGGKVKVSNGFDSNPSKDNEYVILDDKGTGTAVITIDNPTFKQTKEEALRTMIMSMEVDGLYVESDTLKAFLTGASKKSTDIIGTDISIQDVLRDPPGSASYAWLEEGTTYTNTYTVDYAWDAGISIDINRGASVTNTVGVVSTANAIGFYRGDVTTASDKFSLPTINAVVSKKGKDTYRYSYTTTERIQTSSSNAYVGNDGNVFIGSELQTQMDRYQMICIIDDKSLEIHKPALERGSMKLIWSGTDKNGGGVHLVVADQISFVTLPTATFAYAQKHILQNILPELLHARDALILTGTEEEVKAVANATGKIQYRNTGKAKFGDENFGTSREYYELIFPNSYEKVPDSLIATVDEVGKFNDRIRQWQLAIASNEKLMLNAILLGIRNDVAVSAGTSKQVSETTTYAHGYNGYTNNPFSGGAKNFFAKVGTSVARSAVLGGLSSLISKERDTGLGNKTIEVGFSGKSVNFMIKINPVGDFNWQETSDVQKQLSRTVGYKIEEGNQGHVNVAVYRTPSAVALGGKQNILDEKEEDDDFLNATEIVKMATEMERGTYNGLTHDECVAGDFVYYLLGGATRSPWEDENFTRFYLPGTKLGNATLKIDDPKIRVEKPVISNVPTDQPAVFDLVLSNESQIPESDGFISNQAFTLGISYDSNPNGAKLFVDGQPISPGFSIILPRNKAVHKKLELFRGTVDDYEDIELVLFANEEKANKMTTKISAHFQPTSCEVNLTSPTDKWVMNTLSPNDEKGYYIPVKIDGFNVKYHNFDHIELQYKKASQPDESYVNLCSYYADEKLYHEASGNKAMIKGSVIDDIFFYGENDPMEQKYDLRAVSFCRLGNGYVTRSSKVLSGTKDTRLPEVFGALLPKNRILGMGDYIGISFSEAIAGNYLDKDNNFEVVGYTNKTGIVNSTSLTFDGVKGNGASTKVTRNLNGKDFTIDLMMKVDELALGNLPAGERMALFSQGSADSNIEFGCTKDKRLYLAWNKATDGSGSKQEMAVSDTLEDLKSWKRVAATYNHDGTVHFYVGNQESKGTVGKIAAGYNGIGALVYGNAFDGSHPFTGNMLEARLWTRELDDETLTETNATTLTGYERKLLAYYPMNEGRGKTIEDKANGANLSIGGQTWSLPMGRSLKFKGKDGVGVELDATYFNRSKQNSYTLSFWFKAETEQDYEDVALYSEGNYADGGLFIGLEGGKVAIRQNGTHEVAQGNWRDGEWHQLTLSVNRMKNVANLYIDGKNTNQFSSDNLGALGTQKIWLGARNWTDSSNQAHSEAKLKGNIDDIMLWESALSEGYLKQFSNSVPNGGEMGLLVNLTFSHSDTNDNNIPFNAYSPKNHLAETERNSMRANAVLVLTDAEKISDETVYAPVREKDLLSQMNFSWASKDNELVINLNMADKEINKQNVFVTVRDVEDLAGNMIKEPVTMTVFVDRNQLKWGEKRVTRDIKYCQSDKFSVDIQNHGGTTLSYRIEDLPSWLATDMEQGTINPTDQMPVNFVVNTNLDPGEHTALIYLTDENDLSEPLLVVVRVEAVKPDWAVDRTKYPETMNIIASVKVSECGSDGTETVYYDTNKEDIVGAFVGSTCLGVQNIDTSKGKGSVYMSVYFNDTIASSKLEFRLWRANSGKVYMLTQEDENAPEIELKKNTIVGTATEPVAFKTMLNSIQLINLNEGWNWISFNIKPETIRDQAFSQIIRGNYKFSEGDVIKCGGQYVQYSESKVFDNWHGKLTSLEQQKVYMVNVQKAGQIEIVGTEIGINDRKFSLHKGWNHFPYYSNRICELKEALADYSQKASEGDIIKSYDKFAMWSGGDWVGSLEFLTPGEGYLFMRTAQDTVPFTYSMTNEVPDQSSYVKPRRYMPADSHSGNMPIVARFITSDGTESVHGDVLRAYSEGKLVGEATADEEGRFFLMTSAENGAPISFRISTASGQDSEAGATASDMLEFDDATSIGTVRNPFVVDFRSHHIGAFPSPYTDVITFSADTNPGDMVEVSVYDTAGSKVFGSKERAQASRYTLTTHQLAGLADGVYVARITVEGVPQTVKIVKK